MKRIKKFLESFLRIVSLNRKDPSSLEELEASIKRSQIQNVIISILSIAMTTSTFFFVIPVYKEYPLYSAIFLLSMWIPLIATSITVFLFSPISVFASERLAMRKIFFTLMFITLMFPVLSAYVMVGRQIIDISSPRNDKIVSDALWQSGYIQRLPPEYITRIPFLEDSQLSKNDPEPSSGKAYSNGKYTVALRSDAISAIVFLMFSGRIWGIIAIIAMTLATWLDTMLAVWRVKRRVYGLNSLEAEELSQFMWKFENRDEGGGHWIRSPVWVRGYNKPQFGIAEPEAKSG